MRPIAELPAAAARDLLGVFTDIDDTLTTDGRLPAASYAALEQLEASGLAVVPITGRPAAWCDMIARFWPVAGVVGENGAFYFAYDHAARKMIRRFMASEAERRELVPAEMPAGSVVFFLGTLWHGAGPNRSSSTRMAATVQYCEPWARQQENFSLSISRERARLCSDAIRSMLGYSMLFPFIGFVDGRDPKRLLEE